MPLTVLSKMVPSAVTKNKSILPQFFYMFPMIITMNARYFRHTINRSFFVLELGCGPSVVQSGSIYTIKIKVRLHSVKLYMSYLGSLCMAVSARAYA